jgi:hypothetical protein
MKIIDRGDSRFHRCFSMEITAKPFEGFKLGKRKYKLFLTLSFTDQHEEVVDKHKLQIGLNGGELHLKLHKAKMNQANVNADIVAQFEFHREKEEEIKVVKTGELGISSSASFSGLPLSTTVSPNLLIKHGSNKTTTNKSAFTDSKVRYAYESPTKIVWFFRSETVLNASCKEVPLGIIELTGYPCGVTATFKILRKHISLVEVKKSNGDVLNGNFLSKIQSVNLLGNMIENNFGIGEEDEGKVPSLDIGKLVLRKKGWICS